MTSLIGLESLRLVENMTGKKIKVLFSDNRGEYTDKDFTGFYAK